jgi:hypothetical protein
LLQKQRPVINRFDPSELLYMRCFADHVQGDRLADKAAISFPDQSVNRQTLSLPFDVLLPEPNGSRRTIFQGVAQFPVRCVPQRLLADDRTEICRFEVAHDPSPHNYAHTEIRVWVRGARITELTRNPIKKKDKARYRLAIMDAARIIIPALERTKNK